MDTFQTLSRFDDMIREAAAAQAQAQERIEPKEPRSLPTKWDYEHTGRPMERTLIRIQEQREAARVRAKARKANLS